MNFKVDLTVTESGRKRPEYTLDSDHRGELTLADLLDFTKGALIVTADEALKEEKANGFDPYPLVVVDGKPGKNPATVHPLGSIEFESRVSMVQILTETYQGLISRSPVLEGVYISSHYVFINGKQVATDMSSLQLWLKSNPEFNQKDLIRFVNIQPYARKLERLGVTSTSKSSKKKASLPIGKSNKKIGKKFISPYASGVYFLTARSIRSKYKRNSIIKFTYISGGQLGIAGSFKQKRAGRQSRPYLYPTIIISVDEGGLSNV